MSTPEPHKPIDELIEASSLGTPEAKAARASVSDEDVARVMARVRELEAMSTELPEGVVAIHDSSCSIDWPAANDLPEFPCNCGGEQRARQGGAAWLRWAAENAQFHTKTYVTNPADPDYPDHYGSLVLHHPPDVLRELADSLEADRG